MSKRLLFVTGTRADYGKLEPLARSAQLAGFEITFFITGMHMMRRYGETRLEVQSFVGSQNFEFVNQREGDPQDAVLAKTILGFSDFVHEHRPDLVVIHGDRIEALAASAVCAIHHILSAHIEGGEVSGTIDESIRHCNTKLCTTHFVSSERAKQRVLALGEAEHRVYVIGSPELDTHAAASGVTLNEVKNYYDIPFDDYGIVIFHPVTSEASSMGEQAHHLFERLVKSHKHFVVIAPNNDPGTQAIFEVLSDLPKEYFRLIPSMRFAYFSELMKHAKAMIGNSSAGVREAPFFGLPSLDVGSRQNSRAIAPSVRFAKAEDAQAIDAFLVHDWGIRHPPHHAFGSGHAAQRFVEILCDPNFWEHSAQKTFTEG